jgi:hypothetical protein
MPGGKQLANRMRPDITGPAGDKNVHTPDFANLSRLDKAHSKLADRFVDVMANLDLFPGTKGLVSFAPRGPRRHTSDFAGLR